MKRFTFALFIFIAALVFSLVGSMEVRNACQNIDKEISSLLKLEEMDFKNIEEAFSKDERIFSISVGTDEKDEILKTIRTAKRLSATSKEEAKSLLYSLKYDLQNIALDEKITLSSLL